MALYKALMYIGHTQDVSFDKMHGAGATAPLSGIYRCMGCGREVVSEAGKMLPLRDHHEHAPQQGNIVWRLVVWADDRPK